MYQYFFILLSLFSLVACNNSPSEDEKISYIKDYYYPVEQLKEGKVYEYKILAEGQAFVSHYWYLYTLEEKGNTYLMWERYNPLFQKDMSIKEWIINDGVITQEYNLHVLDSATQTMQTYPNKITQNVVFPFNASTDSVMAYRFECELKLPPDFLTVKLVRDRKFREISKTNFEGKEVATAVFSKKDLYDIENKEEGGFWKQQKEITEIYAKGIGLIHEEVQTVGDDHIEVTQLTKIYTLAEFKELQK